MVDNEEGEMRGWGLAGIAIGAGIRKGGRLLVGMEKQGGDNGG